ncbi:MAG: glycosyltransferase [Terracidiphilus sp.]
MTAIPRPRILLLMPRLSGGGAERVMALLARGLSPEKYELHLGLITQAEDDGVELPASVQVHRIGAARVRGGAFRLLRLVRRLKPDLILSGIFHLNFLVLLLRPLFPYGTRVLVRQNGTASAALAFGGLPASTRLLYRSLYRRADRVICQTRAMAVDLARNFGISEDRFTVLPNPVDVGQMRNSGCRFSGAPAGSGPHLFAMGRLVREKGFDLLLDALVKVRAEFPGVSLRIAGCGREEAALKARCRHLGLEHAVCFAGFVEHPWPCPPETTLFVLSSRHEGLPNALLEAAAAGLPIVALPAAGGLADLLRGQQGVWLGEEVSASSLTTCLLAALRALQRGERFAHTWIEPFRLDRAFPAYEALIDRALAAGGRA